MPMLSKSEASANIDQLGDFRDYWRDSAEYPEVNRGNTRVEYPVQVAYEKPPGSRPTVFETTFMTFVDASPDEGRIELEETDRVSVTRYHLGYSPRFQTYFFDPSDGALLISGIAKDGKPYRVAITPTISPP